MCGPARGVQAAGCRVGDRSACLVACLFTLIFGLSLAVVDVAGGTQPYETYEEVVATDGPVAQFRFNDPSGSSTIADFAGSYTAANSKIVLGGEGPFGGSKSGSYGGEAYASLPSSPLAGAVAFTVEGWVDWAGGAPYEQPVFDFGSGSADYMFLTPASSLSGHKMLFEIRTGASIDVQVTAPKLSASKWEYVAVTETSSGMLTLYLNGEQVGQYTGATIFPSSLGSVTNAYLGKSVVSGDPSFDGGMSNVAFYTKALSGERIKAHYDAGEYAVNTEAPTISGTTRDGSTLSAKAGTWTGLTPINYGYQWLLCNAAGESCANIAAATETKYTLGHEDVGKTLKIAASGSNSAGSSTATSGHTAVIEALKPSNTELPAISGAAEQGQLLSVSDGTWEGTPPFSYTYAWQECDGVGGACKGVAGATNSSFRLSGSQVGHTVRAIVMAENEAGSRSADSAVTAIVTTGPPVNAVLPAISGKVEESQTLSTSTGEWAGTEPLSYAYQWQLCNSAGEDCTNIVGATSSTYSLTASDLGDTLRVIVTTKNSVGSTEATSQVSPAVIGPPANTSLPAISGTARDGQAFSASTGTWSGYPAPAYAYQWQSCNSVGEKCANISGATGSTYTLGHSDVGTTLRVTVTATNSAGSVQATSNASAVVAALAPSNTKPPSISGEAREGQTLSATTGEWTGTPLLTYRYQWQDCDSLGESCLNITGATGSTYTLHASDVGLTVRVVVTAENTAGSAQNASAATTVAEGAPVNVVLPEISGEDEEGLTLSASPGGWTGYPTSTYTYQWQDCQASELECIDIAGATGSTYIVQRAVVGTTPRVVVTATNSAGSSSAVSVAAEVAKSVPPESVTPPTISGTAREGQILTVHPGEWAGGGEGVLTYQWESCDSFGEGCIAIAGATGSTYLLKPSDVDSTLRVVVTDTEIDYASATGTSAVTSIIGTGPYFGAQFGSMGSEPGEFARPADVALAKGDVWVLDNRNDRVEKFTETGEYLSEFGSKGSGNGQLDEPAAITIGLGGSVWVMDTGNKRVEEFSESGEYLSQFGVEGVDEGIAVANDGDIWVSNTSHGDLQVFNESGELQKTVGSVGSEPGQLREPEGLSVAPTGDVWVADWSNDRVEEFGEEGEYLKEIGVEGAGPGEFKKPYGIAVGPSGEVWVGEVGNERIQELTEAGEYVGQAGSPGSDPGQWQPGTPMGLAAGPTTVWATDAGNYRIGEWLTPPEAPSNTISPGISGETVDGRVLMANTGAWSGAPLRYTLQWQRCDSGGEECSDIEGARNQTYVLTGADVGKTVVALVNAINAGGSAEASSSVTSVVSSATTPSNTVPPAISGATRDGGTLNASAGAWSGTPAAYAYQWEDCNSSGEECSPIEGATGAEYALGEEDIGSAVRVQVTATNAAGSVQSTSTASAEITAEPLGELEAPSISGTPDAHRVLHADPGAWSGTGRQFSYQWESCDSSGGECAPIEGATEPEYDLGEGEISTTVRVRIGVNSTLGALTDVSPATPEIGSAGALASTAAPTISGVSQAGQALTANAGSWSSPRALSYSYQWQRCNRFGGDCASVEGATESSYTPASGDAGSTLKVEVTASEERHSLSRTSTATQPIAAAGAPASERAPAVDGPSLQGSTLTATPGRWAGEASIAYSYQWERCTETGECKPISGATFNSYTPAAEDVGSTLRVLVTATDGEGSSEALSSETATIEPKSLSKLSQPSIAGVVEIGGELAADPGIWSGSGPVSYAYQWERCNSSGEACVPLEGATEADFLLAEDDRDSTLRVKMTATGPIGSQSAYSAVTAVTPGGEVTVAQAEETAQAVDPAVLAPSTSATLEGEATAPALINEEQLSSAHALTSSSVAKEYPGEFAVNTPDGELSLKPKETSSDATTLPTLVNGTVALFANTFPATDTIVRPDARGATAVLDLRSAEAPKSFTWEVGLGAGEQLQQLSDSSVAVVSVPEVSSESEPEASKEPESREAGEEAPESSAESAEKEREEKESETEAHNEPPPTSPESSTTTSEAPLGELEPQNTLAQYEAATKAMSSAEAAYGTAALMVIEPPRVVDAQGHSVPASLSIHEDTITLTITPDETTTYPVLAAVSVAAPSDKVSGERDPFEYGLADEEPSDFANENVIRLTGSTSPLHIQTARITVPWNLLNGHEAGEVARLGEWLEKTRADHLTPYVTLRSDYRHEEPNVPKYREAVRKIIKKYGSNIKRWGAWNEPDLLNKFYALPERAGHYWQAVESVAVELHCGCTIVAGEFAQYETNRENTNPLENRIYAGKYRKGLLGYFAPAWEYRHQSNRHIWENHKIPSTWGFHDYADVVNTRSTNASEFEGFAKLGKPRIWISEAGVELHDGTKNGPPTRLLRQNDEPYDYEQQSKAANAFLALRYATFPHEKISRIERVYYYTYEAPTETEAQQNPNTFDSGLVEAISENKGKSYGEVRPAYCYLAYKNHDCPPTVKTLPQVAGDTATQATVNPHGLSASVEITINSLLPIDGSELEPRTETTTLSLGPGVLHPATIHGGDSSCDNLYNYRAEATSAGGTDEGSTLEGNSFCF